MITAEDCVFLTSGVWDIYLSGERDNGRGTKIGIMSSHCRFTVQNSGDDSEITSRLPATPVTREQTKNWALQALELAQRLEDIVNNQAFKGPQGEPGENGPNEITEATDTDLTGVLVGNGLKVGAKSVDNAVTENSTNLITSGAVWADSHTKADISVVAYAYDSAETYAAGDFCIHDGVLYKCSTAIATAEAWTAAHWTAVKIVDGFREVRYELIEKIIVGYSVTTEQPANWATNYTDYFTNTGTARQPVYTAVTGASAPAWAAGTYFAFSNTELSSINRITEPDGTGYQFTKASYEVMTPAHTTSGAIYCTAYCGSVNSMAYTSGIPKTSQAFVSAIFDASDGALKTTMSSPSTSRESTQQLYCRTPIMKPTDGSPIDRLRFQGNLIPNTEITIYGVRA